jgi:phosphoribosylaminoimidazole-succinocarboxamide synthase
MEVITEGKVKTVYQGDDASRVIIEYHDKVTAGNGEMVDHPLGKGSLCMRLWKIGSDERFDKDLFRKDEGDIVPAYRYILDRLQPLAIQ